MSVEVHQFVQSFVDHDAISSHVRHLRDVIIGMGIRSEVYAGEWRGQRSKASFFRDYDTSGAARDAWTLYHLSTASPIADYLESAPMRVAVNYHNITPYEFMAPWEPAVAPELSAARRQLRSLAGHTEAAIGVSQYNERELQHEGYRNTSVAPILFDPQEFERELDQSTVNELRARKANGGSDWLFVGRLTPHKCQHQIIQALAVYQRLYDPKARLHIVGGLSSHLYWTVLNKYVDVLGLTGSVFITKGVSNGALGAYYQECDAFVCVSEHEGFGVPLLEAMHNDTPVIAYDAAAVGETVGGGGVVLDDKSPARVAAAVHRVLSDDAVRDGVVAAGRTRLEAFSLEQARATWRQAIEKLVAN